MLTVNIDGGILSSQNLEKTPLADVAPEPWELLDRNRCLYLVFKQLTVDPLPWVAYTDQLVWFPRMA